MTKASSSTTKHPSKQTKSKKKQLNVDKSRTLSSKIKQKRIDARTKALQYKKEHPNTSLRSISKLFQVPIATMSKLYNNKTQIDAAMGRHRYFTVQEEEELKKWAMDLMDHGFEMSSDLLLMKAQDMYQEKYHDSAKHISHGWYQSFMERHEEVMTRLHEFMSLLRKKQQDPALVNKFFTVLEECISQHDILPHRVYCCDEACIVKGTPSNHLTLARLQREHLRKENLTVQGECLSSMLVCFNAAGKSLPPFYVLNETFLNGDSHHCNKMPSDGLDASASGHSTPSIFKQWFEQHFLKNCSRQRPVILLLDSHASHVNFEMLQIAKEHNVILFALPPHTSHHFQPFELTMCQPLETVFEQFSREQTRDEIVWTTKELLELLCLAQEKAMTKSNIILGFANSCIYPCDVEQAVAKVPQTENVSSPTKNKHTTKKKTKK
ncbi:hypothetical protein C9374_005735 [Naegleria lovaniensis]|uniref:HTH CENPB-type domain-containing protein n=1 Tax=Naegleria lovaniensis TaxID=51637 RepID=A0AA88GPS9_NAELO|nr:uncharacterized protein C9374_005735 [Naegleria lovaniensis]KAG2381943.1 hypothetical protein C9374_005735 [Naegleria lovaniensis]